MPINEAQRRRPWKRTKFRALVLRLQRNSLISPAWRRRMLNAIGARIAPTARVLHNCWLDTADIQMGEHSLLNAFAFYDGGLPLIIGAHVQIAVRSTLITSSHEVSNDPRRRCHPTAEVKGSIYIGSGTWIGAGCTVLPGVSIASGCVIGAGSTVVGDTKPDGVYVNAADGNGAVYARRVRDLPVRYRA